MSPASNSWTSSRDILCIVILSGDKTVQKLIQPTSRTDLGIIFEAALQLYNFFKRQALWQKYRICTLPRPSAFLSDPGVPGVRSMGPDLTD